MRGFGELSRWLSWWRSRRSGGLAAGPGGSLGRLDGSAGVGGAELPVEGIDRRLDGGVVLALDGAPRGAVGDVAEQLREAYVADHAGDVDGLDRGDVAGRRQRRQCSCSLMPFRR